MSQPDTPELGTDGDADAMSLLLNRPDPTEVEEEEEEQEQGSAENDDTPEGDDTPANDDDPEEEWESGGQTFKVKKSELRAGYMKDADYRRKTAEVAEQRRAVEAHAQHIAHERQAAANQLDVFLGALQKERIGSQPDQKMIEDDPQEFLRQQSAYQQRAQQFQAALQHRQALQGRVDADQQRQQQEWRQAENTRLLDKMPGWRDEKVRTKESAEIADYLSDIGYNAEELNQLVDHRALLVARDAAKFRALQAAKAKQDKPAPHKPVKPGAAAPTTNRNETRYTEALAKARRTGRTEDAVRVLLSKGN